MKQVGILFLACSIGLLCATSCAKRQVTRIDADTTTDLSGNWNDTDSRLVAEDMIHSSLTKPWLGSFIDDRRRNPVVIAGSIRNRAAEHIEVRTFLKDIQRAFLGSGQVEIVADRGERDEVRDERLDQIEFADPETVKQLGKELGADFMLSGEINSIFDQDDGTSVKYYQIDLQLVDIGTNKIVWLGDKKLKKGITRGKYRP